MTESEFETVLCNVDINQIVPKLLNLALLSPEDCDELGSKPEKVRKQLIIDKVKEHPEGVELFQYALKKLKEHEGPQKIFSTSGKLISKQKGIYICNICAFISSCDKV